MPYWPIMGAPHADEDGEFPRRRCGVKEAAYGAAATVDDGDINEHRARVCGQLKEAFLTPRVAPPQGTPGRYLRMQNWDAGGEAGNVEPGSVRLTYAGINEH